jgi:hypothetical protein
MKKLVYITTLIVLALTWSSCERMLNYPPDGAIVAEDALKTPDDAQRLLNSCYDVLANVFDGSYQNLAELSSNNLATPTGLDFQAVYNHETNFFTPTTNGVYGDFYYAIYRCNSLLENFDLIEGLSDSDRQRMEAEARFIRAFCHWHVAKLWAQPYGYTADNSHLGIVIKDNADNAPKARGTVKEAYDFITSELEIIQDMLPASNGNYANAQAAKGLLAMVYFHMREYNKAIALCDQVINTNNFSANLDRFAVQCTYDIVMHADSVPGWSGAQFQLLQGSNVIATFGNEVTDSTTLSLPVNLVSGLSYDLVWVTPGNLPNAVNLKINSPTGAVVFSLANNAGVNPGTTVYSFTAKGSSSTGLIAIANPETVFGVVSFFNDLRTDELIGNYNASGVLPPNLTLWNDPTFSSGNELEKPFIQLLNETSSDLRKAAWTGTSGSKYVLTRFQDKAAFNIPLIYQTELMLIRAEAIAYAQPGRLNEAIADINMIRARAYTGGNALPTGVTAEDVKTAARKEYRKETIGEGKWIDQLKRLGVEGVISNIRGTVWNCDGMALQFPNNEFTSALFVGNPEGGCN